MQPDLLANRLGSKSALSREASPIKQKVTEFLACLLVHPHKSGAGHMANSPVSCSTTRSVLFLTTSDKHRIIGHIIYLHLDDITHLTNAVFFTYLGMDRLPNRMVPPAPPHTTICAAAHLWDFKLSRRSNKQPKDWECIALLCCTRLACPNMSSSQWWLAPKSYSMTLWQRKASKFNFELNRHYVGVKKAVKATQKDLGEKPPTTETEMASFIQHKVNEGITKSRSKLWTLLTPNNSIDRPHKIPCCAAKRQLQKMATRKDTLSVLIPTVPEPNNSNTYMIWILICRLL